MIAGQSTAVAVHALLEWLALLAGARCYMAQRRRAGAGPALAGSNFRVLAGCLVGAGLGNKAAFWLDRPDLWALHGGWSGFFGGGQSMVGGLLGGLLGVELAKKMAGVRVSTGDGFVFPILLGLAVGRIGCFLAGLHDDTYGLPTDLPWGVDFGDGIPRHPTQLYEIGFAAFLALGLWRLQPRCAGEAGVLFKLMLTAYLIWRLLVDALKPIAFAYPFGLSGLQWLCLGALLAYAPLTLRQWRRLP